MIYIVMRDKGRITDDHHYESDKTAIIGIKDTEIKAKQLLDKAVKYYHPNRQPLENPFDKYAIFILSDGNLYDYFWIEVFGYNEERLTDSNDEGDTDDQNGTATFDDSGSTD